MEIKKRTLLIIGAMMVLVLFGAISATTLKAQDSNKSPAGNVVKQANNVEYQTATLSFKNYEYVMEPKTLKQGIPVKLEVDTQTVVGCIRDVVISAFNVRKYISEGDNIIEFTPDKAGTFWVVCSMNMGRGQFSVAEQSGEVPEFVEQQLQPAGNSICGSGGCGCGA